jgi:hypothetical protein
MGRLEGRARNRGGEMMPFRFEHAFRFTEERYVELRGTGRKKTKPLRIALFGAAGVACLFSAYTLVAGILMLAFSVFGTFLVRLVPGSTAHVYRNTPYLHDTLTYGVDERGLWLAGPLIETRMPWEAAHLWDERDGWLLVSAKGAPPFWFPVAKLKDAGVYESVMELCSLHAARFNSPYARTGRR